MLEDTSNRQLSSPTQLKVFSSPLVSPCDRDCAAMTLDSDRGGGHNNDHCREQDGYPKIKRYEEPTLLEIFFDLFFAATYNAFCDTKQVTNHATFKASIGYFCLLWLTWFAVTLYDVRYTTDSIFARLTTAIQLGVLIGFVVVAPKFDPSTQDATTMQAMSLILTVSRAVLAIQYSWILWHIRRYKKTRLPLFLQVAIHTAASIVYLGVTFRFKEGRKSQVFIVWYIAAAAEAILNLLLSNFSPVLSLGSSHLMKRMALLTVMIVGEGIESMAKKVIIIVNNPGAWDPTTIGHVTAAAATIFFIFLVYFDWLGNSFHLPVVRRHLWISLHLPFHLSLVLFLQGFVQLVIWGKIVTQLNRAFATADPTDDISIVNETATSISVRNQLNSSVQDFFHDYPPKIANTWATVNDALVNISKIPDNIWPVLASYLDNPNAQLSDLAPNVQVALMELLNSTSALAASMVNAVFGAFGIDLQSDVTAKNKGATKNGKGAGFQFDVQDKNWSRYGLVFAYTYIGAGCTIFFAVILHTISSRPPTKGWPVVRLVLVLLLALGTGLASILWFNSDRLYQFLTTSWVSPTLTLVWTSIVIITHINGWSCKLNLNMRCLKHGGRSQNPETKQQAP